MENRKVYKGGYSEYSMESIRFTAQLFLAGSDTLVISLKKDIRKLYPNLVKGNFVDVEIHKILMPPSKTKEIKKEKVKKIIEEKEERPKKLESQNKPKENKKFVLE